MAVGSAEKVAEFFITRRLMDNRAHITLLTCGNVFPITSFDKSLLAAQPFLIIIGQKETL
jgi:hypothetical protein